MWARNSPCVAEPDKLALDYGDVRVGVLNLE